MCVHIKVRKSKLLLSLSLKMRDKVEEEILSSPSREFSFTISLHHHKSPAPPLSAVDLSPADDIFFHGHLLPLHLLSHLPVPSRASTNSNDSFTLPAKKLLQQTPSNINPTPVQPNKIIDPAQAQKPNSRPNPFSIFRWKRKINGENGHEEVRDHDKQIKRKIIPILKKYMRMVRPVLMSLSERKRDKLELRRQPHTFSGGLTSNSEYKGSRDIIMKRGQISAPASMRTSPNHSGLLDRKAIFQADTSDSTMEELQSAIQAAIAHCKGSLATEDIKG